jgi:hypothetical protein
MVITNMPERITEVVGARRLESSELQMINSKIEIETGTSQETKNQRLENPIWSRGGDPRKSVEEL